MKNIFFLISLLLLGISCTAPDPKADAYGNFEAEELIVSAESNGKLLSYSVQEGATLEAGQVVGAIDSAQIVLKIAQLQAGIKAVAAKSPAVEAQLAVFEKQLDAARQQVTTLQREKKRVDNLLKSDAATPKQRDDLEAQIEQAQKQINVILEQKSATGTTLNTQKGGLLAEILPLRKQIEQLRDQLDKCKISNPQTGTVLVNYARAGEITAFGKPLYKLANLNPLVLRAYISGDQLSTIAIGSTLSVRIDGPDNTTKDYTGKVTWISPKAEFTPKIVQTKNERVNLVYAIKISVPNDGALKIGMPAEVYFTAK